jgi:aspartate/methionine/tyrosine aminotransferase
MQSPVIPVVAEWIAAHPGTISLGQGVVHFAAPVAVRESLTQALTAADPRLDRYGFVGGLPELRERLARKIAAENSLDLQGREIVFTAGSNMAFLNSVLAITDPGDEIILPSPYYFNHQMAIEMAGCRAIIVPTDDDYQLDLPALERAITPRTRGIVTVSPNNPTGAMYSPSALAAVNNLCGRMGCYHLSDEAYEYFVYDAEEHFSPGSLPSAAPHTISLFSLSKAYAMAGWRCGYMIVPDALLMALKKIQDTNLICPPLVSQLAAIAALDSGRAWAMSRIAPLQSVRDLVLGELSNLGERCRFPCPQGAFYALVHLDTELPDHELVHTLIRDWGVAVLPGSTFGMHHGRYLRIAFGSLAANTVAEGIGRLRSGLERLL